MSYETVSEWIKTFRKVSPEKKFIRDNLFVVLRRELKQFEGNVLCNFDTESEKYKEYENDLSQIREFVDVLYDEKY